MHVPVVARCVSRAVPARFEWVKPERRSSRPTARSRRRSRSRSHGIVNAKTTAAQLHRHRRQACPRARRASASSERAFVLELGHRDRAQLAADPTVCAAATGTSRERRRPQPPCSPRSRPRRCSRRASGRSARSALLLLVALARARAATLAVPDRHALDRAPLRRVDAVRRGDRHARPLERPDDPRARHARRHRPKSCATVSSRDCASALSASRSRSTRCSLDHDRLLAAAGWARRSTVAVALATRLVPAARARRARPAARAARARCRARRRCASSRRSSPARSSAG